jgi:type III secretion system low calcium response chaperone LcrH/SycD
MSGAPDTSENSETLNLGEAELTELSPIQKKALEVIGSGGTLADVRGLSAEEIETIYSIGFNLYNQAKYALAEPMFQFACFYSHLEPRYWMALGNCRQMAKNYQAAIDAYGMGYMIDVDDPWPPIQAAICYLGLSDKGQAADALTLAEKSIARRSNETARLRIAALRQAL